MSDDDLERRLTALATATTDLGASRGFADRVMLAVLSSDDGFWGLVPGLGRRMVAGFALAAIISLTMASALYGSVEQALASSLVEVELGW
jgi:hypothetical protein